MSLEQENKIMATSSGTTPSPSAAFRALKALRDADWSSWRRRNNVSSAPSHIFWYHAPKCGSSFLNTIYSFACPRAYACGGPLSAATVYGADRELGNLRLRSLSEQIEWCRMRISGLGAHVSFAGLARSGIAMGLFRRPIERIASAWTYYRLPTHQGRFDVGSLEHYASHVVGCMTKMVLGWTMGSNGQMRCGYTSKDNVMWQAKSPVSSDSMKEAVRRLRHEFGFVGLTSQWALSIAMFHAQYGGTPLSTEFVNSRPTAGLAASGWNQTAAVAHLTRAGWRDPFDEQLFAVAESLFVQRARELKLRPFF